MSIRGRTAISITAPQPVDVAAIGQRKLQQQVGNHPLRDAADLGSFTLAAAGTTDIAHGLGRRCKGAFFYCPDDSTSPVWAMNLSNATLPSALRDTHIRVVNGGVATFTFGVLVF